GAQRVHGATRAQRPGARRGRRGPALPRPPGGVTRFLPSPPPRGRGVGGEGAGGAAVCSPLTPGPSTPKRGRGEIDWRNAMASKKTTLPVLNLRDVTYECIYGRGCDGVCCQNGRPPVAEDEQARLDANLTKFLPLLSEKARKTVEKDGYLSRRV